MVRQIADLGYLACADLHRLMVDPSYQRQGIGQKLLDWGIETADREGIVAWLFCRPPGYKLYERNGYKVVQSIDFYVPDDDLEVPPVLAMLRMPKKRAT
jgi:GNAT superfamily N-acetyltransferase